MVGYSLASEEKRSELLCRKLGVSASRHPPVKGG